MTTIKAVVLVLGILVVGLLALNFLGLALWKLGEALGKRRRKK